MWEGTTQEWKYSEVEILGDLVGGWLAHKMYYLS
jgi:hypothetical protein